MSSFCPRIPSRTLHQLCPFLRLSLLIPGSPVLLFCKMSRCWDLSAVFLILSLGSPVWGRKDRGGQVHSYCITSRAHAINLIYPVDVGLDHLAEVMFVRLPHSKVFSPLRVKVLSRTVSIPFSSGSLLCFHGMKTCRITADKTRSRAWLHGQCPGSHPRAHAWGLMFCCR